MPITSRPTTDAPFKNASASEEVEEDALSADAYVGSQTMGTKYAKPWTVFATTKVHQVQLFTHSLPFAFLLAGPCTRLSGNRGLMNGSTDRRHTRTDMDMYRRVCASP